MHHKMSYRLQETMRGFARSTDDSKSARSQEVYGESWEIDSLNNSPSQPVQAHCTSTKLQP